MILLDSIFLNILSASQKYYNKDKIQFIKRCLSVGVSLIKGNMIYYPIVDADEI